MSDEKIIQLEPGYQRVYNEGVAPFLSFIDSGEREFFKAKDFVQLYDLIFKMCIQRDPYNWSEEMYERYTNAIRQYLVEKVAPALEETKSQYDAAFLRAWAQRWKNQKLVVRGLSKLFMYLDRFYTPNTDGVYSLTEQGYRLYKENVFDLHSAHAAQCILSAILRERDNEEQDRQLLQESVNVFVEMGYNLPDTKLKVYKNDLEQPLVAHAATYYRRVSRQWLDQDSCPNYMEKAEASINQERARVDAYLNASTMDNLQRAVYTELLKNHQMEVLNKATGVFHLLEAKRVEDLSRMYRLFSKYPDDLDPIGKLVHEHIAKEGTGVVDKARPDKSGPDQNHSLVRNLIDLHDQYLRIVRDCLGNNPVFQKALKGAFETFINADNRVSKLLAKFVNDVLKKGTKVNTKDIEGTLDNVVFLYGYITEKDVFERDYQIFLANRLLMGLCESEHSEKSMIAKLKTECGYQWTNRLEGMFKDVQLSKDLMQKFKKFYDTEKQLGLTLDVNVCTTGYWPSSKLIPCRIPKDLEMACEKYKRFYLNQHSGHKLDWRMDQGKAEVQVMFSKTTRRGIICSTYQMMILLVFNEANVVSLQSILEITSIPKYEIQNHLLSLAHPKVAVLLKRPNNRELEDDHQFMINGKFTSKLIKVQVPLMSTGGPNIKQKNEEDKAIQLQRRHQMDAAIVRIMKTRKELRHNRLVAEVIQQLQARFKPKPTDIKKRIEALIELEYLKRSDADRGVYQYLA